MCPQVRGKGTALGCSPIYVRGTLHSLSERVQPLGAVNTGPPGGLGTEAGLRHGEVRCSMAELVARTRHCLA